MKSDNNSVNMNNSNQDINLISLTLFVLNLLNYNGINKMKDVI
jgi:hypothetical protein